MKSKQISMYENIRIKQEIEAINRLRLERDTLNDEWIKLGKLPNTCRGRK